MLIKRIALVAIGLVMTPTMVGAHSQPDHGLEIASAVTPYRSVTQHTGVFNGVKVDYQAVAGDTVIEGTDGKPSASIFRSLIWPNTPATRVAR